MKKVISGLFLLAFVAAGHTQILLEEAKISSEPLSMKVDPSTGSYTYTIPENHYREFEKDPLNFLKTRLDIKKFIADNKVEKFAYIEVILKTKKGRLFAEYDDEGELLSSHMNLKDVAIPDQVRLLILQQYRDARLLSSNHIVTSKGWDIKKDIYRVKFNDGSKNRKIKLRKQGMDYAVAGL